MSKSVELIFHQENWVKKHSGPLYIQLREYMAKLISEGQLASGEQLPSEREIAELSQVSRITVRKAVQDLASSGLVTQKQGFGTTVAPPVERVQQSLSKLTSFTEDMARRGKLVESTFLETGLFTPSPNEIMALGLSANEKVARIARLRTVDSVPLAIERAALSSKYLPDPKSVGSSLYDYLQKHNNKPSRATQRISAINLSSQDAYFLEVAENDAGLNIERISYLASGQIVEFTRSIYRGDAYDFVAELQLSE